MIEVKSNIINHPLDILIDSREIHCYIDPKVVEKLHVDKSKLKKIKFHLASHWNQKKDQWDNQRLSNKYEWSK
jgi:hypothetical protein